MRGDHHAFARLERERFRGRQVDARLRLVVARDLRAEDRVPRERVPSRQIHHQRDVAVGDRGEEKLRAQLREPGRNVGPRVESVPGEEQPAPRLLAQRFELEARHDALEHPAVDHVEAREGDFPRAHLLHRGLVLGAPGDGEREPVELIAGRKNRPGFARDPGTPIDEGTEHIEEERLRAQSASTSLPKFSPLKSLRSVSGNASMPPATTSSFAISLPAAIHCAISRAASP